jgi:hypothetical protein
VTRTSAAIGVVASLVLGVLAGCGATGPTGGSTSATASIDAPAPTETASRPPPSPLGPTAGAIAGNVQVDVDDPDISLRLPRGWQSRSVDELRAIIDQVATGMPARVKPYYDRLLARIDAGEVRFVADGPSGEANVTASLVIQVYGGDATLDAAVDRVITDVSSLATPTHVERLKVETPLGAGIVVSTTLEPPADLAAISSRAMNLIVRLADGRTFWVNATGPASSSSFPTMASAVFSSITLR